MTYEELISLGVSAVPSDGDMEKQCRKKWDSIAKPLDGLGLYEHTISRIGGILRKTSFSIEKRTLIVFLADNGIIEEGVSQSDVSVTRKVALAMAEGRSSVSLMAAKANVSVRYVDVGMKGEPVAGIENRRVREGTGNFLHENAMTEKEAMEAISAGYETAQSLIEEGNTLLLLGEMGVGNTTTSAALGCSLLGVDPKLFAGRGSGLSDDMLEHKICIISQALKNRNVNPDSPFDVLCAFGGFDIAAMVGVMVCGARMHVPVVLDGLITLSAALVAKRIFPSITDVCIASHRPSEPMGRLILDGLGLEAPLDASLHLGEGTGAVLLVPQLDACLEVYEKCLRFDSIGMDAYERH